MKNILATIGTIVILCCLLSATPKKQKLTIDWGDDQEPLVLVRKQKPIDCDPKICIRVTTIQNRRVGLRSDGVVVWRKEDLSWMDE